MFKGRLPPIAIDALHAPFCLDHDLAAIFEDALLVKGARQRSSAPLILKMVMSALVRLPSEALPR
jgi:hypothetical protein